LSNNVRKLWQAATVLGVALCVSGAGAGCNSRFDFDENAAGIGGTSSSGASGLGGMVSGGTGGSSATGGSSSAAAGTGGMSGSGSGGLAGSKGSGEGGTDDCGSPGCPAPLHCADGNCAECAHDQDCKVYGLARCDPDRYRCVACLEASDCPVGFACDALASRCLQKCQTDSNCPASSHGCDGARLVCYQCDEDRECSGSPRGSLCASDGSGCVQCRKSTDCLGQFCDQLTGKCVVCRNSADCPAGSCSPTSHTCF
jgi:hypothetical protein